MRSIIGGALLVGVVIGSADAQAQAPSRVDFSQITRPVVQISDGDMIEYLLFELIIETVEPPTSLVVIDVTQNGYGPDDIIVAYPSVETFLIPEFLPDSVQQVMSTWAPEMEFRLDAGNLPADALAALIEGGADTTKRAENAILFDVVQAIERNYRDLPVGLLFERDSIGFTFQIWDYNRNAMEYAPRPGFVADSTVSSVLESLTDIGYLPGWAGRRERSGETVASVSQALYGIRALPEATRQLAARTVLLGSYDLDRSGSIDRAREVDAISCDVWMELDGTFPGALARFGFTDPSRSYRGNIVFSISERARTAVGRRAAACLAGEVPLPTSEDDLAPLVQTAALSPPVSEYLVMQAASEIVTEAGATQSGSAAWAAIVRRVLLQRFDTDSSGALDRESELDAVPCTVWSAITSTHDTVIRHLGFESDAAYAGERIGIATPFRTQAGNSIETCGGIERTMATRARPAILGTDTPRELPMTSAATPIAGLRSVPKTENRQLAARTILLAHYDRDRSGSIDAPQELDAIGCDVWGAFEIAFPGFAPTYGFIDDGADIGGRYRGNIIFSISERLEQAASRRVAACGRDEEPPLTQVDDIEVPATLLEMPVSLLEFLDIQAAARIARSTTAYEPGSAAWASAVRSVLVSEYDADRSGALDSAAEIDAVPCVVWSTVLATYSNALAGLGFDSADQYLGDLIGVSSGQRTLAGTRILACRE